MFYKLSSSVGSGKTQAVLEYIRDNLGVGYLYVCPTVALCEEVHHRLQVVLVDHPEYVNNGPIRRVVTESQAEEPVLKRALEACANYDTNLPPIVIVTSVAFEYLLRNLREDQKKRFHVFIDEGLPAIKQERFSPGNLGVFLEHLRQDENGFVHPAEGQTEVLEWCAHSPQKLASRQLEHLNTPQFRSICNLVVSGNYEAYLATTDKSMEVLGLLSPEPLRAFASVTLVVAIFERTLLPIIWKQRHGIEFQDFPLEVGLFDAHVQSGPRLGIWHVLHEGDQASKRNLYRSYESGEEEEKDPRKQVIYRAAQTIQEHFREVADDAFCWSANKRFRNPDEVLKGVRMPAVCAGLDEFKQFNYLSTLLCVNPQPWVKRRMLDLFELEDDRLYELWRFEHTYQNVGRCSLRLRDRQDPVEVVVTSRRCAEQLHELFPGSKILGQLGDLPRYSSPPKDEGAVQHGVPAFTSSDHSAYSKYKGRTEKKGQEPLPKKSWFVEERLPRLKGQG